MYHNSQLYSPWFSKFAKAQQQPWRRRVLGEILYWEGGSSQTSSEQINEVFIEYPHFEEYSTDWVLLQHFLFELLLLLLV
jgi:hypothetical protein